MLENIYKNLYLKRLSQQNCNNTIGPFTNMD